MSEDHFYLKPYESKKFKTAAWNWTGRIWVAKYSKYKFTDFDNQKCEKNLLSFRKIKLTF